MAESITRFHGDKTTTGLFWLVFERFPNIVVKNAEHGRRIVVLIHADDQSLQRYVGLGAWVLVSVVLDEPLDEFLLLVHIQLLPFFIRKVRLFVEAVRRRRRGGGGRGRSGRVYRA